MEKQNFIKSNLSFIAQFLKHPKEIGAILPSSPLLGKTMAGFVPKNENRFIVELGPGTGPITKALVKIGLHQENLVCLEQSERMVKHLKGRFPQLKSCLIRHLSITDLPGYNRSLNYNSVRGNQD